MAQSTSCQYKVRDLPPLVVFAGWSKAWAVLPAGWAAELKQHQHHSSHYQLYTKNQQKIILSSHEFNKPFKASSFHQSNQNHPSAL